MPISPGGTLDANGNLKASIAAAIAALSARIQDGVGAALGTVRQPTDGAATANALAVEATMMMLNPASGFMERVQGLTYSNGDSVSGTVRAPVVMSWPMVWNGGTLDRLRTPNIFKTAQINAAGDTALWTPAAGKKFRVIRGFFLIPASCTLAARAVETILLRDAAAPTGFGADVWLGQTAPVETASSIPQTLLVPFDFGNGILSAAANNALNVNLGTVLATGAIRAFACGTEE